MTVQSEGRAQFESVSRPNSLASDNRRIVICSDCDAVYELSPLGRGELAHCRNCNSVIARAGATDVEKSLALIITCAILILMTCVTPILSVNENGLNRSVTIFGAASAMARGWISIAAVALALTTLIIPVVQVSVLLWLLTFAHFNRRAPGFKPLSVSLRELRIWSMTEVFLLGALITVIKLSHWLPIKPEIGIWSLAAFTGVFAWSLRFDTTLWWEIGTPHE